MTIRDKLKFEEGVRAHVYLDQFGIPTIGVGLNLMNLDARQRLEARGLRYEDVLTGKVDLTGAQIDSLLDEDIAACVADLKTLMPGFDQMPEPARDVLTEMCFQLGPARLRGFKNTLHAFQVHDWKAAAAGMRASAAYKQTPKRWERNASTVEKIK